MVGRGGDTELIDLHASLWEKGHSWERVCTLGSSQPTSVGGVVFERVAAYLAGCGDHEVQSINGDVDGDADARKTEVTFPKD